MSEPSREDTLGLFEGFGIELEYMIVESDGLSICPLADAVLESVGGEGCMEVEVGPIAWSNELALHVVELKTNGPTPTLAGLPSSFHEHVTRINGILAPLGGKLLPTAMHPWMSPERELRLWPHENDVIYATFDRIFDCRGHGWANLQSVHLNLPFRGDGEFGRLHAAIRLVLPIIPCLAASSPIVDGALAGNLDSRLEFYRTHAARIPSVVGRVIPEPVFTQREYENVLLGRIYRDLAPLDPGGVLRHEWVNARGCIARFDRSAIEIRLIDVQECPSADIAIAAAVTAAVRCLVEEVWCSGREQRGWDERELEQMLLAGIRDADEALIDNRRFLASFGFPERGRARVSDLWQHIAEAVLTHDSGYDEWAAALDVILRRGTLARRIVSAVGDEPDRERLHGIYGDLAACLARNEPFLP